MTHIAVQEALDGKGLEWMEKVSDKSAERRRKEKLRIRSQLSESLPRWNSFFWGTERSLALRNGGEADIR
jgi:hypothetical protein